MKKLLFLLAFITVASGLSSQIRSGDQSLLFNTGYQTNAKRFLLGAQYRYVITRNVRLAPEAMFFFPKDRTTGFDLNLNLHYVLELDKDVTIYPLMGVAMQNNRYMGRKVGGVTVHRARGYTDFGFNLGAGFGYDFSRRLFINSELKYVFSDYDCLVWSFGIGFRM